MTAFEWNILKSATARLNLNEEETVTAVVELDRTLRKLLRQPITANFREKINTKEDLETEGVVALFSNAWNEKQQLAIVPRRRRSEGAGRRRRRVGPVLHERRRAYDPAGSRGAAGEGRARRRQDQQNSRRHRHRGQDPRCQDGQANAFVHHPIYRFQVATYSRLAPNASGLVQLDTLVKNKTPKRVEQSFEITEADILATTPSIRSRSRPCGADLTCRIVCRCSAPVATARYWRRCEKEFGGEVSES